MEPLAILHPSSSNAKCGLRAIVGEKYARLRHAPHPLPGANPQLAQAYSNRALTLRDLGEFQRAVEDLNESIRLDPEVANYYFNRALTYAELGQFDNVIRDYGTAIKLEPRHAFAYANRALAHTILGNESEAQEDVDQAVRLGIDRRELETHIAGLKNQR